MKKLHISYLLCILATLQISLFGMKQLEALHKACKNKNFGKVKKLVEKSDLDINEKNEAGDTPLHIAARKGHLKIVNYLLELEHIDLTIPNNNQETPLDVACKAQKKSVAQKLCKKAIENDLSPLHDAYEREQLDTVRYIIKELEYDLNEKNEDSENLLDIACKENQKEVAQTICGKQNYPLDNACKDGNPTTVKYLIEVLDYHFDRKNYYNNNKTPLDIACEYEHQEVAEYIYSLLRLIGEKPLHETCKRKKFKTVKYLVEELDCPLNEKDKDGVTPFQLAYYNMIPHPKRWCSTICSNSRDIKIFSYLIKKAKEEQNNIHNKCAYCSEYFKANDFITKIKAIGSYHFPCLEKTRIKAKCETGLFKKLSKQKLLMLEESQDSEEENEGETSEEESEDEN